MIHLIVTYCLVLNPTQCRSLEMVPDNYRPITSMTDCMMGGVIGISEEQRRCIALR